MPDVDKLFEKAEKYRQKQKFDSALETYLEINKLSLYENGSSNMLYRGQAEISLSLVNVKDADEAKLVQINTLKAHGVAVNESGL